jgi:CheY-like chemotaxis protein
MEVVELKKICIEKNSPGKHTIMLVDDDIADLEALTSLLSPGYHILTARNGQSALDQIKRMENPENIDLVISNQKMPGMTGVELFVRLRDIISDTPRFLITTYYEKDFIIDAINKAMICQVILKPFDPEEFLVRVNSVIDAYKLQHQLKCSYLNLKKTLADKTEELKSAQIQAFHSVKVDNLGYFIHDINNSKSLTGTITYDLKRDIEKLKRFIEQLAGDDADEEILDAFNKKFELIFQSLEALADNTERMTVTLNKMRYFYRMKKGVIKRINIHECLEAIIYLVRYNYRDEVEFITDFQSSLEIEGNTGEIADVFLYIVTSACNALLQKKRNTHDNSWGTLIIRTGREKDYAIIRFEYDGIGMSDEIGPGLSISQEIIENYHGRIKIVSEEGKDTTVTIYLPVRRSDVEEKDVE